MDPDNPGSPGSTPLKTSPSPIPIKEEPQDDAGPVRSTEQGEVINLISDDEDETPTTANVRVLGSPFCEPTKTLPNLGSSLLSKPKTAPAAKGTSRDAHALYREKLLGKAHKGAQETAQRFRNDSQQAKRSRPRTPAGPASDGMFVTSSRPGTPDAAEVFAAHQRDFLYKRQRGTLTIEEDIEFQRAKEIETARISKLDSDMAYDMTHEDDDDDEDENDMEEMSDLARLSTLNEDLSDDQAVPKKRGVKRKTPTTTKPPKKRGKAAKDAEDDSTEQLLAKARGRAATKGKGKGKGKGKAPASKVAGSSKAAGSSKTADPSKRGRKARPAHPDLLNMSSVRNTDVFEDTAQNQDLPNQPTFGPTFEPSTKKAKALKDLIASVPEEYRPIAKADKKYLDDATKDFTGRGVVNPAPDGNWSVKGLKVTLKHYQVLGVAFMRKRENATQAPKGGLLADTMGLGKTIMMLANIVNGKSLQKSNCRTTLIVASAALVSQWRREIADKVCTSKESKFGIGRVREYHASAQTRSNEELEELQECDVILTTYTQVQKSYPKSEIPAEFTTAEDKVKWWRKFFDEEKGPLHRIKWHRVVLDESQAIKNHQSLTSMACRALEAKHYWAMSGTPILNRVDEFYSTFKFLREPNAGSLKLFRQNFCSVDDPNGLDKLDVFLRKFMIRRTHLDTFFNARLIDLPAPKKTVMWLDFNEIERNVYDIVKARFISRINSFSRAGDLQRQYGHIWTMLLRLRQLTSHILIVQGTIMDLLEQEDFERLSKISSDDLSEESRALLVHIREKLKANISAPSKNIDTREGATIVMETEIIPNHGFEAGDQAVGESHGLTYNFERYLTDLQNSESWDTIACRTLCCGCRQPPADPHVTSCFHIYCHSCLMELQHSFARRAMERHRCNECGQYYSEAKRCRGLLDQFTPVYDNIVGEKASPVNKKAKVQNWVQMYGEVLPSAKTLAVKGQILQWIEEDPDVKIIVYSQFMPMLNILGRICRTEKWKFEKYTGSMSHDARDKAIDSFGNPEKKVRVLLASLKCGGLGLNLTMANRVITLDPWWNQAVEQQAFCRVFRIGQTKDTSMTHLCIKNTIDAAVYALQDSKQEGIDAALDDSKRNEKITVSELMSLFGRVEKDEHGVAFIFAHDSRDDDENDGTHSLPPPPPRAAGPESEDEGDGLVDEE